MGLLETILIGVLCSLIASFVFWFLTFHLSFTHITFSEKIEKSVNAYGNGKNRYRIRILNTGRRNLHEISYVVRLRISDNKPSRNTYLSLGYPYVRPVLYGKKWQNQHEMLDASWLIPIHMTDSAYMEFSKPIYPDKIRTAAQAKTLTLDDIYDVYGENGSAEIIVYAFGYDSLTGARKMFSRSYSFSVADIVEGRFNTSKYHCHYKDYVKHIMTIHS